MSEIISYTPLPYQWYTRPTEPTVGPELVRGLLDVKQQKLGGPIFSEGLKCHDKKSARNVMMLKMPRRLLERDTQRS